ncbi:hypothetical protein QM637_21900, partial [Pantoea allii]|uniref:hypothetical protein n=1 Tax=Pantoea allii TaxID=574096 RepID=UPI0024B777BA
VIPLSAFNILFHHILLKTSGKCVNAIQDGTKRIKKATLRVAFLLSTDHQRYQYDSVTALHHPEAALCTGGFSLDLAY